MRPDRALLWGGGNVLPRHRRDLQGHHRGPGELRNLRSHVYEPRIAALHQWRLRLRHERKPAVRRKPPLLPERLQVPAKRSAELRGLRQRLLEPGGASLRWCELRVPVEREPALWQRSDLLRQWLREFADESD